MLKFNVNADGPEFVIEEENVEITVLKDSSLDIWYFLTIETILGPQRGIYFGIPKEDIPDYSVTSGNTMLDVEKQGTRLKIYFPAIANSGDVTRLKIHLIVPEMVYKDKEGRVGVEFYPAWWDYQRVDVLRVKFIAPEGVTIDELRCYPASADNFAEESGRAFAYWERSLSEGERFRCGISFPEGDVMNVIEEKSSASNHSILIDLAIVLIIVIAIVYGIYRVATAKKELTYVDSKMSMESLAIPKEEIYAKELKDKKKEMKEKYKEEEISAKMKHLLKRKEDLNRELEELKAYKYKLISQKTMTKEEYNQRYEGLMDKLVDIEDKIIQEKMKRGRGK